MPLVRVRHTQPDGRERWLQTVVPAAAAEVMVWSTDPADAAVFDLAGSLRQKVLAWFKERVGRGKVELIEEKTV
jgi:hypothetical protein